MRDEIHDKVAAKNIGIALFDGFALPDTASVVEAFQSANALVDSDQRKSGHYHVFLLSTIGGRVASSSSVHVWTESVDARRQNEQFLALFIAGGAGVQDATRDEKLLAWLRRICPRTELVYPIAEGRLLLDAAGFTYTQGSLRIDEQGSHLSSSSLGAPTTQEVPGPLRIALSIIHEDLGPEITRQITDWVLPPAPTQFTDIIRRNAKHNVSEKIQASARWLEANGNRPVAIEEAAQVAAMSGRNFLRRFKTEMGVTPSDYLLYVRLDMCCRLLVETTLPIDKIARRCGIGSGGRLAKLFRKHLGNTPTDYRATRRRVSRST
ncbi:helix-turn-helix domain-containing protein [Paraburkholderia caribensis]|uniref:Helix-turn-helix domain-containing protein n=2 Tax=Pseudomonadota TaxID=1224 RepID=A0ABV0E856_9BURK|nr:helix-turn-helix domain-containing protein [Paraburkholderia caribensis]